MARKFRWTRALYRRAHREARVYAGFGFMYYGEPALVRRWRELWDQYPQHDDPLTRPHWQRYQPDDGIPF